MGVKVILLILSLEWNEIWIHAGWKKEFICSLLKPAYSFGYATDELEAQQTILIHTNFD